MTICKEYLGDSVYVGLCDNTMHVVVLTTENGLGASNTIVLEPEVCDAFVNYLARHGALAPPSFVEPK